MPLIHQSMVAHQCDDCGCQRAWFCSDERSERAAKDAGWIVTDVDMLCGSCAEERVVLDREAKVAAYERTMEERHEGPHGPQTGRGH